MTPALWGLIMAVLLGLPFSPADVRDAGIAVREGVPQAEMRSPGATGWIGCSREACEVEISDHWNLDPVGREMVIRHEVCHGLDMLSDGVMDGAILGWTPWVGTMPAYGEPTDDVERMGYWCGRQAVLPLAD